VAWHQDRPADWLSVVRCLWLWLYSMQTSSRPTQAVHDAWFEYRPSCRDSVLVLRPSSVEFQNCRLLLRPLHNCRAATVTSLVPIIKAAVSANGRNSFIEWFATRNKCYGSTGQLSCYVQLTYESFPRHCNIILRSTFYFKLSWTHPSSVLCCFTHRVE
jgi:hypothetical protein